MNNPEKTHKCQHCDYRSDWKHNVTRHMVTKHKNHNEIHASTISCLPSTVSCLPSTVSCLPSTVSCLPSTGSCLPSTGSCDIVPHNKQCVKCETIFAKRCTMLKHSVKCQGKKYTEQCPHCNKILKHKKNMPGHIKICQSKALVLVTRQPPLIETPSQPQPQQQQPPVPSVVNNNTNNTNTTNNIQNNVINIQIQTPPMIFEENTPYLFDHITKKTIRQLLRRNDYSELMDAFSRDVLKRSENQCVRKTNLRSSTSSVHVGNNIWEAQADSQVIPKVLCNLAMTLSGSIEEYKLAARETLEMFIEDLTCYGEHGNDNKEEIAKLKVLYKKTLSDMKHNLFNITRQAIGARKAMAMLE